MLGWDRLAAAWASRRNRSTKAAVDREFGEQDLEEGDRSVQQTVAGPVDLGHAAPGDQVGQLVAIRERPRRIWAWFHCGSEPRPSWSAPRGRPPLADIRAPRTV